MATSRLPLILVAFLLVISPLNAAKFGSDWNSEALTLMPTKSQGEGEWRATLDVLKQENRRSGIMIEIREDRSLRGFYLPKERAPGIEGKIKDGSPIQFSIDAEAGDLKFEGIVKKKIASGNYTFAPNKEYAAEAGKLLKAELTTEDLLRLGFSRITLGYVRAVLAAIPEATLHDVVRMRNHGLEPEGIKAYGAAGYGKPDQMVRLRSHGATPRYVDEWKAAGFAFSADEIVKLRSHGVQPEYGAAWKRAGFEIDTAGLVRARSHGVPEDFAAALGASEKKPTLEEVVRMRQHGVNPEFYTTVKQLKPEFSTEEIVRLRQHGVSADYLRLICGTRNDFTAEQIVKLRSYGVPADYIAALNVPDRKPLDAQAIIELRSRGVSAETARKLRE